MENLNSSPILSEQQFNDLDLTEFELSLISSDFNFLDSSFSSSSDIDAVSDEDENSIKNSQKLNDTDVCSFDDNLHLTTSESHVAKKIHQSAVWQDNDKSVLPISSSHISQNLENNDNYPQNCGYKNSINLDVENCKFYGVFDNSSIEKIIDDKESNQIEDNDTFVKPVDNVISSVVPSSVNMSRNLTKITDILSKFGIKVSQSVDPKNCKFNGLKSEKSYKNDSDNNCDNIIKNICENGEDIQQIRHYLPPVQPVENITSSIKLENTTENVVIGTETLNNFGSQKSQPNKLNESLNSVNCIISSKNYDNCSSLEGRKSEDCKMYKNFDYLIETVLENISSTKEEKQKPVMSPVAKTMLSGYSPTNIQKNLICYNSPAVQSIESSPQHSNYTSQESDYSESWTSFEDFDNLIGAHFENGKRSENDFNENLINHNYLDFESMGFRRQSNNCTLQENDNLDNLSFKNIDNMLETIFDNTKDKNKIPNDISRDCYFKDLQKLHLSTQNNNCSNHENNSETNVSFEDFGNLIKTILENTNDSENLQEERDVIPVSSTTTLDCTSRNCLQNLLIPDSAASSQCKDPILCVNSENCIMFEGFDKLLVTNCENTKYSEILQHETVAPSFPNIITPCSIDNYENLPNNNLPDPQSMDSILQNNNFNNQEDNYSANYISFEDIDNLIETHFENEKESEKLQEQTVVVPVSNAISPDFNYADFNENLLNLDSSNAQSIDYELQNNNSTNILLHENFENLIESVLQNEKNTIMQPAANTVTPVAYFTNCFENVGNSSETLHTFSSLTPQIVNCNTQYYNCNNLESNNLENDILTGNCNSLIDNNTIFTQPVADSISPGCSIKFCENLGSGDVPAHSLHSTPQKYNCNNLGNHNLENYSFYRHYENSIQSSFKQSTQIHETQTVIQSIGKTVSRVCSSMQLNESAQLGKNLGNYTACLRNIGFPARQPGSFNVQNYNYSNIENINVENFISNENSSNLVNNMYGTNEKKENISKERLGIIEQNIGSDNKTIRICEKNVSYNNQNKLTILENIQIKQPNYTRQISESQNNRFVPQNQYKVKILDNLKINSANHLHSIARTPFIHSHLKSNFVNDNFHTNVPVSYDSSMFPAVPVDPLHFHKLNNTVQSTSLPNVFTLNHKNLSLINKMHGITQSFNKKPSNFSIPNSPRYYTTSLKCKYGNEFDMERENGKENEAAFCKINHTPSEVRIISEETLNLDEPQWLVQKRIISEEMIKVRAPLKTKNIMENENYLTVIDLDPSNFYSLDTNNIAVPVIQEKGPSHKKRKQNIKILGNCDDIDFENYVDTAKSNLSNNDVNKEYSNTVISIKNCNKNDEPKLVKINKTLMNNKENKTEEIFEIADIDVISNFDEIKKTNDTKQFDEFDEIRVISNIGQSEKKLDEADEIDEIEKKLQLMFSPIEENKTIHEDIFIIEEKPKTPKLKIKRKSKEKSNVALPKQNYLPVKVGLINSSPNCIWCERSLKSISGLTRHMNKCKKRPKTPLENYNKIDIKNLKNKSQQQIKKKNQKDGKTLDNEKRKSLPLLNRGHILVFENVRLVEENPKNEERKYIPKYIKKKDKSQKSEPGEENPKTLKKHTIYSQKEIKEYEETNSKGNNKISKETNPNKNFKVAEKNEIFKIVQKNEVKNTQKKNEIGHSSINKGINLSCVIKNNEEIEVERNISKYKYPFILENSRKMEVKKIKDISPNYKNENGYTAQNYIDKQLWNENKSNKHINLNKNDQKKNKLKNESTKKKSTDQKCPVFNLNVTKERTTVENHIKEIRIQNKAIESQIYENIKIQSQKIEKNLKRSRKAERKSGEEKKRKT